MKRVGALLTLAGLLAGGPALARDPDPDPAKSEMWNKVHASLFQGVRFEADADQVITLETPMRAEDAAVVPVAIRTRFAQSRERSIDRIWLVVDHNPSPVAAEFQFTADSGRADIETRIRIEEYTHVRAVARTADGKMYMVANYVKASGGCSAPAGKDPEVAKANLGRMRLRVEEKPAPGQPVLAQLMVSHPNDTGLAMDQLTRMYAPPHFVRRVEVRYDGKPVMMADVDFSISENPNFRFYFTPHEGGQLEAVVVDNQDLRFTAALKLDGSRVASAQQEQAPQ
ncbi:MAG TPA: quinoprotein dehydrogenase-associated SoxYZ-like carrier [Burkholderiaceae bacterium]|nr:quinoprotein dehydrogenase-associated SoxYZ-like carrier [Burkholderiaceae bacterium]